MRNRVGLESEAYSALQLPLRLGWAVTIHWSQGHTYKHVIANLTNVFEKAQVYVALSRGTSLEHTQIVGLALSKVSD
ncbi:hypothetical protein CALCODRAFT_425816 [Calocera cornea HHB12733]|uniref:ATP-dependent DNA helicase n=1 Tax=Calocera cornea HHB12733 TaxID=1353952 RepID=A0A165K3J8_9BASI|nr:hypothetical protein CALCODRAFT_425816 [Calocera cornea HHB12733]